MAKIKNTFFGKRLRAVREAAGMTRNQLAEAAGLHPNSLVQMESGIIEPLLSTTQRIAAALGKTPNDFCEGLAGK